MFFISRGNGCRYNPEMLRPLIFAILGGFVLCALWGVIPQPPAVSAAGGLSDTTEHPQMEVAPAVSSTTASQLQSVSLLSCGTKELPLATYREVARTTPAAALTLQHSLQASILLRI
jgi:hypothetical protein